MRKPLRPMATILLAGFVLGLEPNAEAHGVSSATRSGNRVLLDKQGSGEWTSPVFDPTSDWQIAYNFNCANQGGTGNFIVSVYGPGNSPTADGANELKKSGAGTTYVHDVTGSGSYLQVNSECNWRVTVKGSGSPPTYASVHPRKTLLNHTGSGAWTSPTFWPRTDWQISYSYNCASQDGTGNFIVDVYGPGNTPSVDGVNELKTKGGGSTYVHDVKGKGSYIRINSECNWHVVAAH